MLVTAVTRSDYTTLQKVCQHTDSQSSFSDWWKQGGRLALKAVCGHNCYVPDGQRTHCERKGVTTMSDIPNDDQLGFVAEKPR